MKITFDVFDWELVPTLKRSPRDQINECIAARLEELGHQLPPFLLQQMQPMTEKENQEAWINTLRALGYSRLETMRDEQNRCHRFTLYPATNATR